MSYVIKQREHKDSFSGIGTVTVRPFKIGKNGKRQYFSVTKHNLIVQAGRGSLIDLITGTKTLTLKYIRYGKGGALAYPAGDPLNPLPVQDTDTDVASMLLDKPLSAFTRVSTTQVDYVETLICDEVDSDVNEAAILFENAADLSRSIFARITFPTVRLTIAQGTGIELKWSFNFSKADEIPVSYSDSPIQTP